MKGKRIIKASRVFLSGQVKAVEFLDSHEEHVCPVSVSVQNPFAAPLPTSSGQILVWEQYQSGR